MALAAWLGKNVWSLKCSAVQIPGPDILLKRTPSHDMHTIWPPLLGFAGCVVKWVPCLVSTGGGDSSNADGLCSFSWAWKGECSADCRGKVLKRTQCIYFLSTGSYIGSPVNKRPYKPYLINIPCCNRAVNILKKLWNRLQVYLEKQLGCSHLFYSRQAVGSHCNIRSWKKIKWFWRVPLRWIWNLILRCLIFCSLLGFPYSWLHALLDPCQWSCGSCGTWSLDWSLHSKSASHITQHQVHFTICGKTYRSSCDAERANTCFVTFSVSYLYIVHCLLYVSRWFWLRTLSVCHVQSLMFCWLLYCADHSSRGVLYSNDHYSKEHGD